MDTTVNDIRITTQLFTVPWIASWYRRSGVVIIGPILCSSYRIVYLIPGSKSGWGLQEKGLKLAKYFNCSIKSLKFAIFWYHIHSQFMRKNDLCILKKNQLYKLTDRPLILCNIVRDNSVDFEIYR